MNAQAAEKTPEKKPEAKPTTEKKEKPVSVNLAQLDKEEQELQKKLEELQKKKAEAKAAAAAEVYAEVRETLTKFADSFTTEQKKTLGSLLGMSASTAKKAGSKGGSKEATIPKFKLPEGAGGHTWSGRGRRSNEFTSWLETANGKEWAAKFAKGEVQSEFPLNPEWREANPGKN